MQGLATSTVAMSAYNMLAISPQPFTAGQLYSAVCKAHGIQFDQKQFIEALQGLVSRSYLKIKRAEEKKHDTFELVDPAKRRVRWRDRTGDGWENWMVESPRGPQPLVKIVRGNQ